MACCAATSSDTGARAAIYLSEPLASFLAVAEGRACVCAFGLTMVGGRTDVERLRSFKIISLYEDLHSVKCCLHDPEQIRMLDWHKGSWHRRLRKALARWPLLPCPRRV